MARQRCRVLMLYRPQFCCNCGERIDRVEWRLWTSRRFCELCETEYKGHEYLTRGVVAAGAILGVFGFTTFLGFRAPASRVSEPSGQRAVGLGPVPSVNAPENRALKNSQSSEPRPLSAGEPANSGANVSGAKLSEQPAMPRQTSEEKAFFCGAQTKKGTPCSRRVKNLGLRCWQHTGAESILR